MALFRSFSADKNFNGKSLEPLVWVITFYPCKFQEIYTSNKKILTKTGYWCPHGRADRQNLKYKTSPDMSQLYKHKTPQTLNIWDWLVPVLVTCLWRWERKHLQKGEYVRTQVLMNYHLPSFNNNFLSPSTTINYLKQHAMSIYGHQKHWKHS